MPSMSSMAPAMLQHAQLATRTTRNTHNSHKSSACVMRRRVLEMVDELAVAKEGEVPMHYQTAYASFLHPPFRILLFKLQ